MNPQAAVSAALGEAAFLLERQHADTHRTQAFRRAEQTIAGLTQERFAQLLQTGDWTQLPGIGTTTAGVIAAATRGEGGEYLERLRAVAPPDAGSGRPIAEALRGDLHSHSDWSDGGSSIELMAETARALGHEYLALTDHSPRLTVANGLTRERLERQLTVVAALNATWSGTGFRLLTGIEVDILDDGALDQDADLLAELDIVVASVHSKLRMSATEMTPRMVAAIANPAVTVLGHCTGRMTMGRGPRRRERPPSDFDAALVFEAARRFDVAIEINARPERRDPPMALLRQAVAAGCTFTIDTDAHAPGQLAWLPFGAERAARAEVPVERIRNTWPLDRLVPRGVNQN